MNTPILVLQSQDRSVPRVWYDMIYIQCKTILTRSLQMLSSNMPCHATYINTHHASVKDLASANNPKHTSTQNNKNRTKTHFQRNAKAARPPPPPQPAPAPDPPA